ncbi:unnamed protein product [Musa acuminata subsp. burmannicoides]
MLLSRESITNSVVMIQPSLFSYSSNSPPAPASLDVASMSADRILMLDAYFSVVVFHGMTIAQWLPESTRASGLLHSAITSTSG